MSEATRDWATDEREDKGGMGMNLIGGRRVRWVDVVRLLALLGLLGFLAVSIVTYRYFEVCVPESRAALTEFPAFGDTDIDPDPNFIGSEGDCGANFFTTAPADRVIGYYSQQLSSNGWTVRAVPHEELYGGGEKDPSAPEGSGLAGKRGDLCYYVTTEAYPRSDPPGNKSVSVQVKRADSGSKLSPAGQC